MFTVSHTCWWWSSFEWYQYLWAASIGSSNMSIKCIIRWNSGTQVDWKLIDSQIPRKYNSRVRSKHTPQLWHGNAGIPEYAPIKSRRVDWLIHSVRTIREQLRSDQNHWGLDSNAGIVHGTTVDSTQTSRSNTADTSDSTTHTVGDGTRIKIRK